MWIGTVDLPPGEDGKRRRKTVSSKDKATAIDKLRKLRRDVEDGVVAPATNKTTVSVWMEMWLKTIAGPQLNPRTLQTYRAAVKNNIDPHIGKVQLAKLTPAHVRSMHTKVLASGRSTRTVEVAHRILTKALRDAVREGVLSRATAERVTDVSPPKVLSKSRGSLTTDQARAVLRVAIDRGDPMVTRYAAALLTGARQGEMLGLQWDRVNLEHGTLDLSWQLQRLPMKKGVDRESPDRFDVPPGFEHVPLYRGTALTRPKTATSMRVIPLPEPLALLLIQYKAEQLPNQWDLVWVSEQFRPISSRDDSDAWHDALAAADVPDVPLHAARHTTASLLMEAGVDAHVIASIMGHSNILTTRGYQHVNRDLARQALSNLDGLLSPP
jgi:integrase